ncbi:MAG: (2Fe-2S)-binding protein [Bryobacteraceae bacterium]|nr:(2Fe-2S)-binding protein [Bryobacteraceae bacterium]
MSDQVELLLQVNGAARRVEAWPLERLLDVLRHGLGLKGTKEGCGEGECGSCVVIMDGKLVVSCLVPALEADGSSITTIEGLGGEAGLDSMQQAFVDEGAAQCGFCTPGMIMAANALCQGGRTMDHASIREGLAGNLCRCTGYMKILAAVRKAGGARP